MKFKYFLRGLGIGIIFTAIVLLTAYMGNPSNKMTDAEIIEKAKALGMVEKEDKVKDLLSTESDQSKDNVKDSTEDDTEKSKTEQEPTGKSENTAEQQIAEENVTTEENVTIEENVTTEDLEVNVTITINGGDSSYVVAQKLQEAGLIEDVSEFDAYLIDNGYASRIRVGSYELKKGMDFKALAEAVSDTAQN